MINYYDEDYEKLKREKKENFFFHIFACILSIVFGLIAFAVFKLEYYKISFFLWFCCGAFSAFDSSFFIDYQRSKLRLFEYEKRGFDIYD